MLIGEVFFERPFEFGLKPALGEIHAVDNGVKRGVAAVVAPVSIYDAQFGYRGRAGNFAEMLLAKKQIAHTHCEGVRAVEVDELRGRKFVELAQDFDIRRRIGWKIQVLRNTGGGYLRIEAAGKMRNELIKCVLVLHCENRRTPNCRALGSRYQLNRLFRSVGAGIIGTWLEFDGKSEFRIQFDGKFAQERLVAGIENLF